jgi:hypothetical protein
MAQPQSVLGIFGLSPEMYAQRRQDELEAEQMAVGKMSSGPGSLLNPSMSNIYGLATQQGQMIGQGVRGLLGVEDPEMQMVRDVQQLRSQFDTSTSKGLRDFASALAPKYPELAMKAAAEADKREESAATVKQKSRESIPTPDVVANRVILNDLVSQFGEIEGATRYNKLVQEGKVKVAAASAPPAQRQIFEVEKDRAKKVQKELDSGYTVLERLNEQATAIKSGVIGGSFADTRTALATLGATLGIADPKLINALSNTRSFKANELALGAAIAKQLGVNPTDKDFIASLDQFARNSDDPRAALLFIEQLQDKFGKRVKINEDMMNVYLDPETGGSFRNYKGPKMIEPFTSSNELERLLAEKANRANKKTKGD